ncbi:lantibiotic dehydratase family protein [Burkholderia sp. SCN-KJ]|uniref:lantibiotic dehydratase family protein n=1 Tax=Burkholderia sp. SCN-KJ TaxID=2969248 RepID=UPI0021502EE9|nr:lantibiotic dehydratase family protein [Burkholderia sp. SCN-KJ]MCR4471355.1 lantibiotic dehydratase family protein [Burkholderia sp. SCN-KJ]
MKWSLFFWMRSAGFPFDTLDTLAIDAGLDDEIDAYRRLEREIGEYDAELMALARAVATEFVDRLERRLATASAFDVSVLPAAMRVAAGPLADGRNACIARRDERELGLHRTYAGAILDIRRNLVVFFRDDSAREALYLSNPEALLRIDALAEHDVGSIDSRTRQRLRLAWNYIQRLCAKNDTTSFFGPIAWGRFAYKSTQNLVVRRAAGSWLASRKTMFEHWVVERLAEAIAADTDLADGVPLMLNPGCDLRGTRLHVPVGKSVELGTLARKLISAVADTQSPLSARRLLAQLAEAGFPHDKARSCLEAMLTKRVIARRFDIGPGCGMPIPRLHEAVTALDAPAVAKEKWLDVCARLEVLRARFETGDLLARQAALEQIDTQLADAGVDRSREHGRMYVGRFPVYEDCARNLRIEIGGMLARDVQRELDAPLRLYTWLVDALAVRLHDRYLKYWHALSSNGEPVDFLAFISSAMGGDAGEAVCESIRAILRDAWAGLSGRHAGVDEICLSDADWSWLFRVLDAAEPRAGVVEDSTRRVHSPDFMIAAASVDAVARGEYSIVVGEVHPGVHTVSQPVAQPFCPFADAVRDEVQALLAPATLVAADSPRTYQRSHIDWLDVPALHQLELPGGGARVDHGRRVRAGAVAVVLCDGVLVCRDRASGIEANLLTVMPTSLQRFGFALAGEAIGQCESRRIKCGRVLIKRRTWEIDGDFPVGSDNPFEKAGDYLAWRGWARATGLPRYVFMKCASEPKPVFVDFRNPFAIDLLARWARKGEPIAFSEMRPAGDELWLADERGRYCSEFRTSCIDTSAHEAGDTFGETEKHAHPLADAPALL